MRKLYWIGGICMIPILILAVFFHKNPLLTTLGNVLLLLICMVVFAFVIVYSRRNWRETEGGRSIMYMQVSLAVVCGLSLATVFLGPYWEWRPALRLFLFGGILLTHARLFWTLVRAPHNAREEIRKAKLNTNDPRR